jgi:hypothetical protein
MTMETNIVLASTSEVEPWGERSPAEVTAETQLKAAVAIAHKVPRNPERALEYLKSQCERVSFAEEVDYMFPRGKRTDASGKWVPNLIRGPSVEIAREAALAWGNITWDEEIVYKTDSHAKIATVAWDVQRMVRVRKEDAFDLVVKRGDEYLKPGERDERELINRRQAFLTRNCLLQLVPRDIIDQARQTAYNTLVSKLGADLKAAIKNILERFKMLGIEDGQLQTYLGHKIVNATAEELVELMYIGKAIQDGIARRDEYFAAAPAKRQKTSKELKDVPPETHTEGAAPQGEDLRADPETLDDPASFNDLMTRVRLYWPHLTLDDVMTLGSREARKKGRYSKEELKAMWGKLVAQMVEGEQSESDRLFEDLQSASLTDGSPPTSDEITNYVLEKRLAPDDIRAVISEAAGVPWHTPIPLPTFLRNRTPEQLRAILEDVQQFVENQN